MDRRGEETEGSRVNLISTEIVATRRSPTDNTMMAGVTEKQATSSSFSERVKNTFGNTLETMERRKPSGLQARRQRTPGCWVP